MPPETLRAVVVSVLGCFAASWLGAAAPAAEGSFNVPVSVTIELGDFSGRIRSEFRRGEPIWATVRIRNVGREPLKISVPAAPAQYVQVEAIGPGAIGERREHFIAPDMLMGPIYLEPDGSENAASILVNEYVSFRAGGEQDIRILLQTSPAITAGETRVTINGTLSDEERSNLLRHMYAAYRGGAEGAKARVLRSLVAVPSGGREWEAVALLGLSEDESGLFALTRHVLAQTDLKPEELAILFNHVATHGYPATRSYALRVLEDSWRP